MRKGLPSGTSFLVCFARGLGVDDDSIDPFASELLPPWLGRIAAMPARFGSAASLYRNAVRVTTLGLVDHAVLRTRAIDGHLESALEAGVRQLVILGAGLDARAWRIEALKEAVVFEVDHPATQAYKRVRTAGKAPPCDIRYVAVDFEEDRLSVGLEQSGFRRDLPSVWIWEGVTMYLPVRAVQRTMHQVTDLAAEGSFIALTYRVPDGLPFGALGRAAIPMLFAAAGEPLRATFAPSELEATFGPGWEVVYDDDPRGWQKLTRSTARPSRTFSAERLAVARRRP